LQKSDADNWTAKFNGKVLGGIIVLPIVLLFRPQMIVFGFLELWQTKGTPAEWLGASWPLLLWGTGVTAAVAISTRNDRYINHNAESILYGGTLISLRAGVIEEITCRWLFFLSGIAGAKAMNFLFFGFMGFGIGEWVHLNVIGHIVNFTSLGFLEGYIFHPGGWAVGASMVAANMFFRDGHRYQGIFGWSNSWFIGLYFFWFMFRFGLPAAIVLHFTYDFLIFLVIYLDAAAERARGYA
jgi:hypothetical protein